MSGTLKRDDIRPCDLCGNKLCATGVPLFYRVRIERIGVDLNAVRQLDGLTMFFRGAAAIADAFAPSTDIAKPLQETPDELLICDACAVRDREPIMALTEIASTRKEAREKEKGASA